MPKVTVTKNRYTIDSLYQWDVNQVLEIWGLSLAQAPEIHFAHDTMTEAIVRQATMDAAGVIRADIPNGLLQKAQKINAYVCDNGSGTFQSLYKIVLHVEKRAQPSDYEFTEEDGLVYSVNALQVNTVTLEEGAAATVRKETGDGAVRLTFGIPRGKKGDKGDKGDTGNPGPQGLAGNSGDWSQNDDLQTGFVQNRTHWKDEVKEDRTVVDNSLDFTRDYALVIGPPITNGMTVGRSYVVTWAGVDYACICREIDGYRVLGNYKFKEDTGEPFYITKTASNASYVVHKQTDTAETIAIKVVEKAGVVWHKLDKNFLPDNIAGANPFYTETETVEALAGTIIEVAEGQGVLPVLDLVEGATYTVDWNGTKYECACTVFSENDVTGYCLGDMSMLGGAGNGEPFVIVSIPAQGATMVMDLSGTFSSVYVAITGEIEIVHGIEGKYLPEGTPYLEPFEDVIAENLTFSAYDGLSQDVIGAVTAGKIYNVNWGGTIYPCLACASGFGVLLGSSRVPNYSRLPYTAAPFVIEIATPTLVEELGYTARIFTVEGIEEIPSNISIVGGSTPHKIDKRLMDVSEAIVVDFIDGADQSISKSFDEAASFVTQGKMLFA